jgi:hypothetical protein
LVRDFDDVLLHEEAPSGALAFSLVSLELWHLNQGYCHFHMATFEACQQGECFYAVNSSLILCTFHIKSSKIPFSFNPMI